MKYFKTFKGWYTYDVHFEEGGVVEGEGEGKSEMLSDIGGGG